MHIKHVEIGNFRKLRAVRVDFAKDKTVFVGANNSGKTSAMAALRRFLVPPASFSINDFTLCHWKTLNDLASEWEAAFEAKKTPPELNWSGLLPFLDVWLDVATGELHHVQKLLPTLEFTEGLLGVRLQLEPKEPEEFQRAYLTARTEAKSAVLTVATVELVAEGTEAEAPTDPDTSTAKPKQPAKVSLWPQSMTAFLERTLQRDFTVRGYRLNPAKLVSPKHGEATPQDLPAGAVPIDGFPFTGLICIDEIDAQRGFGQSRRPQRDSSVAVSATSGRRLSNQLKSYYDHHLDPARKPQAHDIDALAAIEAAQEAFDGRLKVSFKAALKELEDLGYPGVTDPKLTITTRVQPADGLNHDSAVQYEVPTFVAGDETKLRLPEDSNGLGYQNLVSMVFDLMSFRDRWMKVGKAATAEGEDEKIPPLHLVLVEEPEAHLHAQVQQVFIKQSYSVLRNHPKLGASKSHTTQLIVSTHSSHVAHECEFASLRYFRRTAAKAEPGSVPLSSVVNLSDIFGADGLTERFTTRYLRSTHCDLFFADGAVLMEGPAERILIPHLVHEQKAYEFLRKCYVTWLEIGGSHAHRLRPLIDSLGIPTLIVSDIDAKAKDSEKAVQPKRSQGYRARNATLKTWTPGEESLDALLDMPEDKKVAVHDGGFVVRAAYQHPVMISYKPKTAGEKVEAIANTFEDALVFENLDVFKGLTGFGLIAKFRDAIADAVDVEDLGARMFAALKDGEKAAFALDMLDLESTDKLKVPTYIHNGLLWLAEQLKRRQEEVIKAPVVATKAVA
jgi:predicted ATP-dependent endonuclease of OLD family